MRQILIDKPEGANKYPYLSKASDSSSFTVRKIDDFFWIENLEDEGGEVVFSLKGSSNTKPVTLEYSIDRGENWTEFNTSELNYWSNTSLSLTIPSKATMYIRGNNECFGVSLGVFTKISCSKQHNIGGNLASLLSKDLVEPETLPDSCFVYLFYSDSKIIDASKLIMLSKTSNYCYQYMFKGCTSLTTAPKLPATTLANNCYYGMFSGCTSLTTAPALPATTLADSCYSYMFLGCTALTAAPELPATMLAQNCYNSMFLGCTALTAAPELPATTLADGCYSGMFRGCTSLTTAPELPATTLAQYCYDSMFYSCTNLNYVKAMFTSIGTSSLTNWLSGTASIGTFVKNSAASWTASDLGLPDGWTIEDAAA